MRTLLVVMSLAMGGCFVDGKPVIMPTEPDYAAICVDSIVADDSRHCWGLATVTVTIPNPLLPDTTSQP